MVASRNAAAPEGPIETGGRIATGADLDVLLSVLDTPGPDTGAANAVVTGSSAVAPSAADPRLLLFRDRFGAAIEAFVNALAQEITWDRAIAELPRP